MVAIIGGLNRIRDLINTDVDKGILGTATNLEERDDLALGSEVAVTEMSLTSATTSKFLEKTYTLSPTIGNGNTYTEYGVKNDASNTFWSRITFTGVPKTIDARFTIKTRWIVRERNR